MPTAPPAAPPTCKSWAGKWNRSLSRLCRRLPDDLAERFADYTALQNAQGLPFASCGGQTVCRYTFRLTNYPGGRTDAQANLLLSGTAVIAGDVMLLGEDGGRFPLAYPK